MADKQRNPENDEGAENRPLVIKSRKIPARDNPEFVILGILGLIVLVILLRSQARDITNLVTFIAGLWVAFKLLTRKLSQLGGIKGIRKKIPDALDTLVENWKVIFGALGILAVWALIAALVWYLPLWFAESFHVEFYYQDDAFFGLLWPFGCGPVIAGIVLVVGVVKTFRVLIPRFKQSKREQ